MRKNTHVFPGYVWAAEHLVRLNILDDENWPGALFIGHVVPWMVLGYIFGFVKGWRITIETVMDSRRFRIFALLAVIFLLGLAALPFVF